MQPNEQPQYSIDYLDSISTVPKGAGKGPSDKLFFGVIFGGLLIALAVGVFAFLSAGPNTASDLTRLSAKLQSSQDIADASQKNIVSSNLRGTNTQLSLILTNANNDVVTHLASNGLDAKKLDPKVVASENTSKLLAHLEDARLNAVFDRTYAREMSHQLETLILFIDQLKTKTDSASLREYLETTRNNLEPIRRQYAEFNAATS